MQSIQQWIYRVIFLHRKSVAKSLPLYKKERVFSSQLSEDQFLDAVKRAREQTATQG
jgi:hypothetical protein